MRSIRSLVLLGVASLVSTAWLGPLARADGAGAAAPSPWIALARGRVEPPGGIIPIAASRDGVVREVGANEGDLVARGAVLATLDDTEARLRVELAEMKGTQAHVALAPLRIRQQAAVREVHRLEQLVAQELANSQDLDEARDRAAEVEADLAQGAAAEATARAELALAQFELMARAVRAPVDGRIIRRLAAPGEGVTAGSTPLFWLAPTGPQLVRAQLDEDSVPLVTPGETAEVLADSDPGTVRRATVRQVGLYFGPKPAAPDDPSERQDVRAVDCVLVLDPASRPLLIGQRVLVRFLRQGPANR